MTATTAPTSAPTTPTRSSAGQAGPASASTIATPIAAPRSAKPATMDTCRGWIMRGPCGSRGGEAMAPLP